MRDEIQARLQRVNTLWQQLEQRLQPATDSVDVAAMIRGELSAFLSLTQISSFRHFVFEPKLLANLLNLLVGCTVIATRREFAT